MEFNIKLAGCNIAVSCIYGSTKTFCHDYLTEDDADFSILVTREDIDYEKEISEKQDNGQCKFSDNYLEKIAVYRKIAEKMPDYDAVLFHGSAIAMDNKAYLFTARSGTGKSTHSRIWREQFGDRAIMVNDDKPLIKVTDNDVTVYGTPWNGKHRLGNNIAVSLKAICILARGEQNQIDTVSKKDAYPALLQQVYYPADVNQMAKTLKIFDKLLSKVELYKLSCNMDSQAAVVSYNAMK